MVEYNKHPQLRLARRQIVALGIAIVMMVGIALGAMALGRSTARGARTVVTYSTEAPTTWLVSDADGVNARSGPGYANEVVLKFGNGDLLQSTGRIADVQDETWREVSLQSGEAVWVRAALLTQADSVPPINPPSEPPVTTPPGDPNPPGDPKPLPIFDIEDSALWDVTGIIKGGALNVRNAPGVENSVIARLAFDATALRSTGSIAKVDTTVWRQVAYAKDKIGWVNAALLTEHIAPPVFGTEKPASWDVTGVDAAGSLHVRKGPGTNADVISKLAYNAAAIESTGRIATVSDALWREVKYDAKGTNGWVRASYLKAHVAVAPTTSSGIVVMGDWNGDGIRTPAVFTGGTWSLRNSNAAGAADTTFEFGAKGDQPVAGDWNGDGIDTVGVMRGGTWFLRNSNSAGPSDVSFTFGQSGDVAVAGDWDGDGIDTPGVFRSAAFYLRNSNSSGSADASFEYGDAKDKPVAGDWNGDGVDTVGVVRGDRWLLRNSNSTGLADIDFRFGDAGDRPVAGDWSGGGIDSAGVARGSSLYLRNHNSSGPSDIAFSV